ncbi:MAG: DNA methyltransferase [Mariprofundus sp.]
MKEFEPQRHGGTKENQDHSDIASSPSDCIGDLNAPMDSRLRGNDNTYREAEWPEAKFIVGNPPFLGDKKMIAEPGEEYTKTIRKVYKGRVPGGADLVTYWFDKAQNQLEQGKDRQAGLMATNSIRQKRNRPVLEHICKTGCYWKG